MKTVLTSPGSKAIPASGGDVNPPAHSVGGGGLAVLIIAGGLLLWEALVAWRELPVYILPAPSRIVQTLLENPQTYSEASTITLLEAFLGLFLGGLAGALLAVLLSFWPRIESGVMTLAILVKSTPLVAIAPLLTIWLGFGMLPKVLITALITFFPVLVNLLAGLQAVEATYLDTFRSWHASRGEIFWHLRIPQALPYFFAGLKVSGPLALIGAVVAEWTGASGGLGRVMWLAYANLNLPYLFAAVFVLSAAGMALYLLLNWLERKIIFWRQA